MEVAAQGITVNRVAPGSIGTDHGEKRVAAIAQPQPIKRIGTAQDVTEAVVFL